MYMYVVQEPTSHMGMRPCVHVYVIMHVCVCVFECLSLRQYHSSHVLPEMQWYSLVCVSVCVHCNVMSACTLFVIILL